MKSQLFIPTKCKVGFNQRSDTYTGKLGYVIYHDGKVWRKENSWESWREKYISPEELEAQKRAAYERDIKYRTDEHKRCSDIYNSNPNTTDYYAKQYGKVSLEQHLKQCGLDSYDTYRFYPGKVSKDEGIKPLEFENKPMEGFVLNKKVGGDRYGWNPRQTYTRVYDPRGFEFEITVPNLLYILQETNSIKGKGLEGEFVYAWDGKDLVLLPCVAQEYKSCKQFTDLQTKKVSTKDLIIGGTYLTKKQESLVYLGKFNWYDSEYKRVKNTDTSSYRRSYNYKFVTTNSKRFIFYDIKHNSIISASSIANIAQCTDDNCVGNYAELMEIWNKDKHSSGIAKFIIEPLDKSKLISDNINSNKTYIIKNNNKYGECTLRFHNEKSWFGDKIGYSIDMHNYYELKDNDYIIHDNYENGKIYYSIEDIQKMDFVEIYAEKTNGEKIKINKYN